jgi:hypothetical protein
MHQHQPVTTNGHHIELNRTKSMVNGAAHCRHRVLWRKDSTAPMGHYPGISPHLSASCHDALRCLR